MAKNPEKHKPESKDRLHNSDPSIFLPSIESSSAKRSTRDPFEDDLIVSLSDSRENRRARQVFEWETIRRNSVANTV